MSSINRMSFISSMPECSGLFCDGVEFHSPYSFTMALVQVDLFESQILQSENLGLNPNKKNPWPRAFFCLSQFISALVLVLQIQNQVK